MILRLVKTDLDPEVQRRIIRMALDARHVEAMTIHEQRAIYFEIEAVRSLLNRVLQKVDTDVQH